MIYGALGASGDLSVYKGFADKLNISEAAKGLVEKVIHEARCMENWDRNARFSAFSRQVVKTEM